MVTMVKKLITPPKIIYVGDSCEYRTYLNDVKKAILDMISGLTIREVPKRMVSDDLDGTYSEIYNINISDMADPDEGTQNLTIVQGLSIKILCNEYPYAKIPSYNHLILYTHNETLILEFKTYTFNLIYHFSGNG